MINIIFIDNVIGGGKTTLINQLYQRHPDWYFIEEGVNFEYFKQNLSQKAKENLIISKVYNNYLKAFNSGKNILIADRAYDSVYRWCKATKFPISSFIKEITRDLKQKLDNCNKIVINLIDDSFETTLTNIHNRGRIFEQEYTINYLKKINKRYSKHFPGFSYNYSLDLAISPINYEFFPDLADNFIENCLLIESNLSI